MRDRKKMTLRIERHPENQTTIFQLSGRMRFDGLLELKRHLDGVEAKLVLDLKEVTHVDLEVVHFLGHCVQQGIELRNCPSYIREWIRRDQGRQTDG
jgi:anti-anti-sigma regulatory factor